tara:strand:+ start:353 stop:802 length:450 start_codon:yes stop_codon:yes gene_type:complete
MRNYKRFVTFKYKGHVNRGFLSFDGTQVIVTLVNGINVPVNQCEFNRVDQSIIDQTRIYINFLNDLDRRLVKLPERIIRSDNETSWIERRDDYVNTQSKLIVKDDLVIFETGNVKIKNFNHLYGSPLIGDEYISEKSLYLINIRRDGNR